MSTLLGVSQKCQYALKALFELSLKYPSESVTTIEEIAKAQEIPARFLEQILSKLRIAGHIESRRGNRGGYVFTKDPAKVTVGQIMRVVEGYDGTNPFEDSSVFHEVWRKAQCAADDVFNKVTFQKLIDIHKAQLNSIDFNI